jgi:putative ABC transport system permease protein
VLSLSGAFGGVLLTLGAVRYFRAITPVQLPPGAEVTVNGWVLSFTMAVGVVAGIVSGILPAWRASGVPLGNVSSSGGRAVGVPGRQQFTRTLIAAQATLSVMLLIGAGSLIQTVLRFASAPLGFDPTNVFAQSVVPPSAAFAQPDARARLYQRVVDAFDAQPALGDVALSSALPPRGEGAIAVLEREGHAPPDPQHAVFDVAQQSISIKYFEVMRVPLRRGRTFERQDSREATPVCIVNEALVRKYFHTEDPIGQRIRFAGPVGGSRGTAPPNRWLTIVGVAADERRTDTRQELGWVTTPLVYSAITQRALPATQLLVRPRGAFEADAVRRVILAADAGTVVGTAQPLTAVIGDYFRYPRFRAGLLALFATMSLGLAAVGLYALLAQAVSQRTGDIGVRLALGASRGSVLARTLSEGMGLVTAGIAVGVLLAIPLKSVLAGLLYDVSPTDVATLAPVIALLLAAGVSACYFPARRASRIDPIVALRSE